MLSNMATSYRTGRQERVLLKQKISWLSMLGWESKARSKGSNSVRQSLEETGPSGGPGGYDNQHATTVPDDRPTQILARPGSAGDDSARNSVGAGSPLAQRAWQPEQQDIRRERLVLTQGMLPASVISALIVGVCFLGLSWNTPIFGRMSAWFVTVLLVFALRVFFIWRGQRYVEDRDVELGRWEMEVILGSLCSGLCWAALLIFVPPANEFNTFLYVAFAIVVMLVCIPILGALMPAVLATLIPTAIGVVVLIAINPNTQSPVLWVLAAVFAIVVRASLQTYRALINDNVKYRLMNARLTAEMMVTLEDPTAGVLRILKGEVRYANERMSEITGLPIDTVMHASLASLLGPGPWSDPNWTQLKQALSHGLPQTFNWWLPNAKGAHQAVKVRIRGVWDFSQSHGGVMLFSPLSQALLFSSSAASESLPIVFNTPDEWLTYARADRRKRSANPVMVVVLRPSAGMDFKQWRTQHEGQLLRRLSARETICFDAENTSPCAYLWLSATVRDLTVEQVRAALLSSLSGLASSIGAAAPREMAQLEMSDGADLARLRNAATLQVGVARADHEVEPDEALERAIADSQTYREARFSVSRPSDSMPAFNKPTA